MFAGLARRWCSPCTRSSRSTSPSRSSPAGTRRSSRPTSSPAPSSPASHGADADGPRADLRSPATSSRSPPRQHGEGHPADRLLVGYAYAMEFFIAWYSGNPYERSPSSTARSALLVGLLDHDQLQRLSPQLFWFKKERRATSPVLFIVSIFVNIGMWFERFVITVHLAPPRLPRRRAGVLLLADAIAEVKSVVPQADPHYDPDAAGADHGDEHGEEA
jgi:hypothetical protein